jgi:hypothetical protein
MGNMSIKIYRKSDLQIVSTVPEGITPERDFEINVGGDINNYGFIDVSIPHFRLERINGVVVAVEIDAPPIIIPEPEPTKEDLMGIEIAKMKLVNFQNLQTINQIGADLTKAKLDIIQIKGGI